jgi:pimeloyl-ACP methyl ester carboxylesterase
MAVFVLVPGAWLGGWCWRDVAAPLRRLGHDVVAVTLTGLGGRAHLLSREIGLATHVDDVVGLLHERDLKDVALVGHSYGGTVITSAAERISERLARLVYLDASIPRDGQSNNDVIGPEMAMRLRTSAEAEGEGWRVPPAPYVLEGLSDRIRSWAQARLAPHPLRCFEEPVRLRSPAAAALPRAFIRTSPRSDLYARLMAHAREAGWYCRELTGGHYAMLSEPQAVAAVLNDLPGLP